MLVLVSCKHRTLSGKSVTEQDEPNILDRVRSFQCDGLLGVYSSVPSPGLSERLRLLRDNRSIQDFRVFDARLIENHLVTLGYSTRLMRYFSLAHARLKPIHALMGDHYPLKCKLCSRDVLNTVSAHDYMSMVCFARKLREDKSGHHLLDVYWFCKGSCDMQLESRRRHDDKSVVVAWEDIADIANPAWYVANCLEVMGGLRSGYDTYEKRHGAR